jgi:hypothetical protein
MDAKYGHSMDPNIYWESAYRGWKNCGPPWHDLGDTNYMINGSLASGGTATWIMENLPVLDCASPHNPAVGLVVLPVDKAGIISSLMIIAGIPFVILMVLLIVRKQYSS